MSGPEYRLAERQAYCRACDKVIKVDQPMVSWYSSRNRGMHIHICPSCVESIHSLVPTEVKKINQED